MFGYIYKYTLVTYDWFCGPGLHITIKYILLLF